VKYLRHVPLLSRLSSTSFSKDDVPLFGRLDELIILYAVNKGDYKPPIYFDVSELVKYVKGADSPSLEPSGRPRRGAIRYSVR